jgi:hypothetical protein
MIVKAHRLPGNRLLLAVCDSKLVGQRFEDKGLVLDLTAEFYRGKETSKEELMSLAKRACMMNLVGKNSVDFAVSNRLVDKHRVIVVDEVPHAQVMFLQG